MNKNTQPSMKDIMAALGIGAEDSPCGGAMSQDEELDIDYGLGDLEEVLKEAFHQVASGKGNERHGHGLDLYSQPWMTIADQVGNGFLTGQAIKKLMEASSMKDVEGYSRNQFERELLGAIAYAAFAVMHMRVQDGKDAD